MGIEEQMLHLEEVPDSIQFLERQLEEVSKRVDAIDAVSSRLDELPIHDLLTRVDTLELRFMRTGNITYECEDSSLGLLRRWKNELVS